MAVERTIGVDVGGTKIVVGVVERDGTIVRVERRPTPVESTDALLGGLAAAVESVLDDGVAAVGIGIPSAIDQRSGTAVFSVNIPLADVDVRTWAADTLSLPAAIDNDANCAALAEWRAGAGRGTTDMVMITLGTGIGGGLILGSRLYRGWIGAGRAPTLPSSSPRHAAATRRRSRRSRPLGAGSASGSPRSSTSSTPS